MKCLKCNAEIENNSKFCNNCGTELEDKPLHVQFDETLKSCQRVWYLLGFLRAIKKDSKKISEIEEQIRNYDDFLWQEYLEVVEFWKNWAKDKNDEKNKKTNGSK